MRPDYRNNFLIRSPSLRMARSSGFSVLGSKSAGVSHLEGPLATMVSAALTFSCSSTIIWHCFDMPDEQHLALRQTDQARTDFGAIEGNLRIHHEPTRGGSDVEAVGAPFSAGYVRHGVHRAGLGILASLSTASGRDPATFPGKAATTS
jgi:hypothetical protein